MRILKSSQFIAEGAGAGYEVKFEGLKFDFKIALINNIGKYRII